MDTVCLNFARYGNTLWRHLHRLFLGNCVKWAAQFQSLLTILFRMRVVYIGVFLHKCQCCFYAFGLVLRSTVLENQTGENLSEQQVVVTISCTLGRDIREKRVLSFKTLIRLFCRMPCAQIRHRWGICSTVCYGHSTYFRKNPTPTKNHLITHHILSIQET